MGVTETVAATVKGPLTPSLDDAFAYCAKLTAEHYENFPVASLFLPEEKRPYIQAIYAFSRVADDFADEQVRPAVERMKDLEAWEEQLHEAYRGTPRHPVFIALAETVRRLDIPIEPLQDLLKAFKQDVTVNRYETFDDLQEYCRHSANPVGRLVLIVFGYRSEELFRLSDDICTALQLTNFWQDVAIDRAKDRCYLPLSDIREYGYSVDRWTNGVVDDSFRSLMKFEVARTRDLFYRGATLPASVERDLQLELKLVWFGGMRILRKIERAKYDVIQRRPRLSGFDKARVLGAGLFFNDLTGYRKPRERWDLT